MRYVGSEKIGLEQPRSDSRAEKAGAGDLKCCAMAPELQKQDQEQEQ